ncbi:glycosyltransferase [Paenibacillus sp. W2I17]|uniref:CgeB family protein n=1 Tax=Paenibacillus TaxID=44249 RepID=UPI002787E930|nr:glycosyltransferase [Paenibacillus sp. W2I17]MDQ0660575.1 spore maturation protein CgeB [Paenibacillus sp. W2I17]
MKNVAKRKHRPLTEAETAYRGGYAEGRRFGGCQAMMERVQMFEPTLRDMKVLYIPQGFDAIDEGVTLALQQSVRECVVGSPAAMLQEASQHRPDVVLVMNGLHVFPADHVEQVNGIRALGIRTAVWFVDDPYFTEDTTSLCQHYDVVFTHEEAAVPFYLGHGANQVIYMPLAVNPGMFQPRRAAPQHQHDICFIGTGFWNRIALFDELAPFLADKKVFIAGSQWNRLARFDVLGRFIHEGWIAPGETVDYYNGAKIVINIHRTCENGEDNRNTHHLEGHSINPRTYEISACGTMQITDARADLPRYYKPGYDIETFTNAAELQRKIHYYLKHEEERQAMAWRGLLTTMNQHTFTRRIGQLLEHL